MKKPEETKKPAPVPTQEARGGVSTEQPRMKETAPREKAESADLRPKIIDEIDTNAVKAPIDISKGVAEIKPVRERSRSKSKEKQQGAVAEKPQETPEDRYAKAQSAKERYLQRKKEEQEKLKAEAAKQADTK